MRVSLWMVSRQRVSLIIVSHCDSDQKHTFKCVAICLGILCVILAAMLIALSSYGN